INVRFQNGTAELTGLVATPAQRLDVIRLTQEVPGVQQVRDSLAITGAPVAQAQAVAPGPLAEPKQLVPPAAPAPGPRGVPLEPAPIFSAPPGPPMDMNPPAMPPYAWPTYAAYNNYSRVGYPLDYPYCAYPFIGPIYPFPKVPLGWRAVTLNWRDGYWWF